MKIAITGKGGTGKTTIAAVLSHFFKNSGYEVLAVDADPDSNLAEALGAQENQRASLIPISAQRKLIQDRTGAKPQQFGQLFKLNPTVNDIPDNFCVSVRGIKVLVMGSIERGGDGCACPENVLLRSLLSEILLNRNEVIIVDMEAGIEHLGRATARSIDIMLIVVEPGQRSIQTAETILKLGRQIGIQSFGIIGNKIQNKEQILWIQKQFPKDKYLGSLSFSQIIGDSDREGGPLFDNLDSEIKKEFQAIYTSLTRGF
ncbi:MAG: AAA family ATPase [Candidatus Aminicenantes bacterium]|nr:AAA family ATPase [Candidatus Aminicenantes bacterium]